LAAGRLDAPAAAFFQTTRERGGVVEFDLVDSDGFSGWVETSTAVRRVGKGGRVTCDQTITGRLRHSTANVPGAKSAPDNSAKSRG
jgi:hypothetical protein